MPGEDSATRECEQGTEKEYWKLYSMRLRSKNNPGPKEQNEWTIDLSKFETKQNLSLHCAP